VYCIAAESSVHNEDLPSEHQLKRFDLFGHIAFAVVAGAYYLESAAIDLLVAHGS
jgi:hypothetical protein